MRRNDMNKLLLRLKRIEEKLSDDTVTKVFAEEYAKQLKENIKEQKLKLEELNPAYKAWKEKHGYDTRVLIRTGKYVDSIQPIKMGKDYVVRAVGEEEDGLSLESLAFLLEFGTYRMPPRPHWGPTLKQMKGRYKFVFLKFLRAILE